MKLTTAVTTLHQQAAWLGMSGPALLQDIEQHGRLLYPDVVVRAYDVYRINQILSKEPV